MIVALPPQRVKRECYNKYGTEDEHLLTRSTRSTLKTDEDGKKREAPHVRQRDMELFDLTFSAPVAVESACMGDALLFRPCTRSAASVVARGMGNTGKGEMRTLTAEPPGQVWHTIARRGGTPGVRPTRPALVHTIALLSISASRGLMSDDKG